MSNHGLGGEAIEAVQETFAGIVVVLTDGLMFLRLFRGCSRRGRLHLRCCLASFRENRQDKL